MEGECDCTKITVLSLTLIILEKIIGKSLRCEQNFARQENNGCDLLFKAKAGEAWGKVGRATSRIFPFRRRNI